MSALDEEFQKILQFLRSNNKNNVKLGIQLLKSTRNPLLLGKFLSDRSYISGMISFPLVTLFQEHPSLWEQVQQYIPAHRKNNIQKWLSYHILELEDRSIPAFCQLATKTVQAYLPDFPILSPSILTEHQGYYCASVRSGKQIENNIGWSLTIEARDIGPAEVIHEEEWIAVAHHPNGLFKVEYHESGSSFPRTWLAKESIDTSL